MNYKIECFRLPTGPDDKGATEEETLPIRGIQSAGGTVLIFAYTDKVPSLVLNFNYYSRIRITPVDEIMPDLKIEKN